MKKLFSLGGVLLFAHFAFSQALAVSITNYTNISCNSLCNGSATATPTGGVPPYTYSWAPGNQLTPTASGLCAGSYTVYVTDNATTQVSATVIITQPQQLAVTGTSQTYASCNGPCNGSAVLSISGGVPPYSYSWNVVPVQTTSSASNLCAGTYSCSVTDGNGCFISGAVTISDSCAFVWPGDANEDGVADNNDILSIGIANGATGTTRAGATTNWIGQPCADWGQTFANGTDYKYADCDGNGTIANADTNAVVLNYGSTHTLRPAGNPPYNSSLPDLTISMNQSQLPSNSPGSLTVSLGNSTTPANNIYGLAFTINFDPNQIDAGTFGMSLAGSWMGTVGNNLMGVKLSHGTGDGSVEVAITRTDQTNTSGYGDIAQIGFMTTNALTGTGNSQEVHFTISNVNVIDASEVQQQVNAVGDSTEVIDSQLITGISPNADNTISIFPNPVHNELVITTQNATVQNIVRLYNASGQLVREEKFTGTEYILPRGNLASGLYSVEVITEKGVMNKKVVLE